jgi:MioC protein
MAKRLKILVGTMTGTAELVAEEVAEVLEGLGWEAEILMMDRLGPEVLHDGQIVLICTSTYGQGDVPDNGQSFIQSLRETRPDLSSLHYGLIALGDMTYAQTFCEGGKQVDRLLEELGAKRMGEPFYHNASSGTLPEDEAGDWAAHWAKEIPAEVASAA